VTASKTAENGKTLYLSETGEKVFATGSGTNVFISETDLRKKPKKK